MRCATLRKPAASTSWSISTCVRLRITQARPWGAPSGSSSSYGGNPMAGAAILASVSVIDSTGLLTLLPL